FLRKETQQPTGPQLQLTWMHAKTERGARARASNPSRGLTINDINVGGYGDIPDSWHIETQLPRGAMPPADSLPSLGYSIYDKVDQWADSCGDLYEEAIQRRWAPALDIPWDTVQPLPEEIERAMCQICTELSEAALHNVRVLGRWLQEFAYGYHEVKLYLATEVYSHARHFEGLRKRALVNGGGLGVEAPGMYLRNINDARKWTDLECAMFIVQATFHQGYCLTLARYAHNEAERRLFTLMAQDLARSITYGMEQIRLQLRREPRRRNEINSYLNRSEAILMAEIERDVPLTEAFEVVLGGGIENAATIGKQRLEEMRRWQVERYLKRVAAMGLPERAENPSPQLAKYLPQREAQPV
ncbi:MAG TPA: hypothetical protein VNL92_05130, partial [Dehalococcoidia bacterium]|nr:hypothetical protein [Dehalococcoidia bacterium]